MLPQIALLALALWTAWRPAETVAATPVLLALGVLLLLPWAHRHTPQRRMTSGSAAAGVLLVAAAVSAVGGWNRSTAITELALAAAVAALAWIASRQRVARDLPRLLALGLSALAVWGLWQVTVGFDRARSAVATLPEDLQINALERLESGRAFASLLLPGHLAVLLAAALPILVAAIGRSRRPTVWATGAVLCGLGLLLTRSPIGIGLGVLAMAGLVARRRSTVVVVAAVVLTAVLVLAVAWRPDVGELDPVRLRLDNWRTALWVWSSAPVTGVGLGSFGQAAQAVPFTVGNRPAHVHNLPLEWAAELGLVGLALFLAAAWWLGRLLIRLWSERPELALALGVVAVHNLVDFSLYTSGVAIPWAVILGWGLAEIREPMPGATPARGRLVLVGLSAVVVAGALLHATSVTLERAAGTSAAAAQRFGDAALACRIAPWRVDPLPLAAAAALESGHRETLLEARKLVVSSRRLKPRSATLAEAAGRLDLALDRVPTGASELYHAARLQPASGAREEAWVALVRRLESGESGAAR